MVLVLKFIFIFEFVFRTKIRVSDRSVVKKLESVRSNILKIEYNFLTGAESATRHNKKERALPGHARKFCFRVNFDDLKRSVGRLNSRKNSHFNFRIFVLLGSTLQVSFFKIRIITKSPKKYESRTYKKNLRILKYTENEFRVLT